MSSLEKPFEKSAQHDKTRHYTSNLKPSPSPYIFPFEKLDVWKMGLELADYILALLDQIPLNKHLRLVSQMQGAVTSVPQNIAEGKGRQHKKEFIQFLSIAQGSLYETVTLNEIFKRRNLITDEAFQKSETVLKQLIESLTGL